MPKITLDAEQKAMLADLAQIDQEWRDAKETLRAKLEAQLKLELDPYEAKRNAQAYACKQAGIPVMHISRDGLGTTATRTAYDAIKAGGEV